MKYMYIDSVATAIGMMLIKNITIPAGVPMASIKHHASKFARIINFR